MTRKKTYTDAKVLLAALGAITVGAGTATTGGGHVATAQPLTEDEVAFNAAISDGRCEALQEFLILFPDSPRAEEIFQRLNACLAPQSASTQSSPVDTFAPIDPSLTDLPNAGSMMPLDEGRLPAEDQISDRFFVTSVYEG